MKEELIKLAKEKGFISDIIGKSVEAEYSTKDFYYLWMCELHKWLREVHNIHIEVKHTLINEYSSYVNGEVIYIHFKSYEQALEEGIKAALKLIKS